MAAWLGVAQAKQTAIRLAAVPLLTAHSLVTRPTAGKPYLDPLDPVDVTIAT